MRKERYSDDGRYIVRDATKLLRTDYKQECMGKEKILISYPGYLKPTYNKECGCSEHTLFMYVLNEEEGMNI